MKVDIIIPTIRDVNFLSDWAQAGEFDRGIKPHIIICEDHFKKEIKFQNPGLDVSHYTLEDVKKDLGKDSWIIPPQTGAIRSFGILKSEADVIISLDDDCYPNTPNFIKSHLLKLEDPSFFDFANTYRIIPRGVPYSFRRAHPTMISHGLWVENPDLDSFTELGIMAYSGECARVIGQSFCYDYQIPEGLPYSMCGMNLAFRKEIKPAMFFQGVLPRYDDIFAGLFSKKVCDAFSWGVKTGYPLVRHSKKSSIYSNSAKETKGFILNEVWHKALSNSRIVFDGESVIDIYKKIIGYLPDYDNNGKKIKEAMRKWIGQFQ